MYNGSDTVGLYFGILDFPTRSHNGEDATSGGLRDQDPGTTQGPPRERSPPGPPWDQDPGTTGPRPWDLGPPHQSWACTGKQRPRELAGGGFPVQARGDEVQSRKCTCETPCNSQIIEADIGICMGGKRTYASLGFRWDRQFMCIAQCASRQFMCTAQMRQPPRILRGFPWGSGHRA